MLSKKIVKYIQSLSHKKSREQERAFVAEGPKVVEEILFAGKFTCKILCATADWLRINKSLVDRMADRVQVVGEDDLARCSALKTPHQVIAVFEWGPEAPPRVQGRLSLMLDDLQDPGNLGTLIRIADWFGVDTIICSEDAVDCFNPKVIQASMGSISRVAVHYASLPGFIREHQPLAVYAAALEGRPLHRPENIMEGILLIGNESRGLRPGLLELAQERITIPRYGGAESLNAAVAAGIILSWFKSR